MNLILDFGMQKNSTGEATITKAIGYGAGVKFRFKQVYTDLSWFSGRLLSPVSSEKNKEQSLTMSLEWFF